MEQITAKQDEIYLQTSNKRVLGMYIRADIDIHEYIHLSMFIYLICLGTFQDLIQCVIGVTATDSILLKVAQVNICSEQDLEGVLVIPRKKTHTQYTHTRVTHMYITWI